MSRMHLGAAVCEKDRLARYLRSGNENAGDGRHQLGGTWGHAWFAAGAADIPAVKAPEPVPNVWSWNGFYGGLNAGFASAQSDTTVTFLNTVTGAPLLPPAGSVTSSATSQSGWIGGGQIGYNFTTNNWLYGVEGDFQWANEKGAGNFLCAAPAPVGGVAPAATCLTGAGDIPSGSARHNSVPLSGAKLVRHSTWPRWAPDLTDSLWLYNWRAWLWVSEHIGDVRLLQPCRRCNQHVVFQHPNKHRLDDWIRARGSNRGDQFDCKGRISLFGPGHFP